MRLPGTQPTIDEPVMIQTDTSKKPAISIDPVQIVFLVLHKWPILVLTTITFTLIAYLYAKSADYIYRAGARVEVFHEARLKDANTETDYDRMERYAGRHIIIMTGEMFHRELIAKLSVKWGEQMDEDELKVPFKIKGVRGSGFRNSPSMIDLFVDSKSEEYALDYLNGILGSYRSHREREVREINENALAGLRSEGERIQSELTKVKSEIAEFEFENKVLVAKEREQMKDEVINDLIGRLQMLRTERLLLEYQYKEIANADLTTISETLNMNQNPQIREFLFSQRNSQDSNQSPRVTELAPETSNSAAWKEKEDLHILLENKYHRQLEIFQTTHPKMRELKNQIDTLKSNLERQLEVALNRFQASYKALRRKEDAIEEVIKDMQNNKILSPEKESEYLHLKNYEAQMEDKYDMVYKRLLANASAVDGFSFITIQEPYLFEDPIAPNKLMLLAIGPFIGLTIGVVFILFKGFFIPTIYPILKEYGAKYKES